MAPNVELHFWPANDLNGDSILTITDEDEYLKEVKLRITLDELGFGEFTLARRVGFALFDSGAVQPEVFVRVLVHAYSSTEYLWGFFLDKREQVVIHKDEEGGEEFRFGGPGPKFYLDRAALQPEQFTGTGWLIDLENGVFRWDEDATAGKVLNKLILEDAASDAPALPDLTKSFTNGADSDSVSWTTDIAGPGEFELPIGQSFLTDLWELEDLSDLRTTIYLGTVSDPVFRLDAWNAYGEDVSGSAFGAGVCRLVEGVNIAEDSLTVKGTSLRKASHVIVKGKDGAWVTVPRSTWDPGEYVKYATINYTRSSNPTILTRAGLRWLRKQDNGEKQITVEILPGADDATGLYFPKPTGPLWIGNTVALHTGGDVSWTPLDYRNEDQLVTGLELELLPASVASDTLHKTRSWKVRVQLNYERGGAKSPGQGTSEGGSPVGGIQLCAPSVVGCHAVDVSGLPSVTVTNGDAENASGTEWSGGAYTTSRKHAGSRAYEATGATATLVYDFGSQVFEAGVRYILDFWRRIQIDHDDTVLTFGSEGGDEVTQTYQGEPGGDDPDLWEEEVTGADGGTWQRGRICWTPSAERTDVRFRFVSTSFSSGWHAIDDVKVYSGGEDTLTGTDARAARCDHGHLVESLSTAETDTDLRLAPDGAGGVEWAAGGGSGAPTGADYLVGTAHGDLSAEIVVGTSPGGELGGTWASPTVDATHSGSTHSAATDTHIANGTDAHDASAISYSPTGSISSTDVQAAIAEVASEAGAAAFDLDPFIGTIDPYRANSTSAGFAANTAILVKFIPRGSATVDTVLYRVSTTGGNLDFGIYDENLNLLASTGSFAAPAAAAGLTRALDGAVNLVKGTVYYFAFVTSSTSFRMPVFTNTTGIGLNLPAAAGVQLIGTATSALPLPDPISPTWDASSTTPTPSLIFYEA